MGIEHCRLLEFPIVADPRGNLTFVESNRHIPFEIKRVYYLYDVPGGAERGIQQIDPVLVALHPQLLNAAERSCDAWPKTPSRPEGEGPEIFPCDCPLPCLGARPVAMMAREASRSPARRRLSRC